MLERRLEREAGFTLLELMIVVVIIAILAAIALPAYTKYVQRTRRSDGQSALFNAQQAEEKFFYRCNRYGSMDEIYGKVPLDCTTAPAFGAAIDSPQQFYRISLTQIAAANDTDPRYALTAAAQGVQLSDPCGDLGLNSKGMKTASGDAALATDGDIKRCWH